MITRRALLLGSTAAAALATVPVTVAAANTVSTAPVTPAKSTALKAYVVGSEDCFDWKQIWAKSYDDAVQEWVEHQGIACECGYEWQPGRFLTKEDCPKCSPSQMAERVEAWDGMDRMAEPGDWIAAGLSAWCNRCGEECCSDDAYAIKREAVCEDCMEIEDWEIADPERAAELRDDDLGSEE